MIVLGVMVPGGKQGGGSVVSITLTEHREGPRTFEPDEAIWLENGWDPNNRDLHIARCFEAAAQRAFTIWPHQSGVSWLIKRLGVGRLGRLTGPSLSGAMAVGLKLLSQRDYDRNQCIWDIALRSVVISANAECLNGPDDIKLSEVGDLAQKLHTINAQRIEHNLHCWLLAETQVRPVKELAQVGDLVISGSATVKSVIEEIIKLQARGGSDFVTFGIKGFLFACQSKLARLRFVAYLVLIVMTSWYSVTEYWGKLFFSYWYDWWEYLFLCVGVFFLLLHSYFLQRAVQKERDGRAFIPLKGWHGPAVLVSMCNYMASEARGRPTEGWYKWGGRCLSDANPNNLISLEQIRPKALYCKPAFCIGLTVFILVEGVLASPYQFHLGDLIARTVFDPRSGRSEYITGGKVCSLDKHEPCRPMSVQGWPGGLVVLDGGAPAFGRLEIGVQNAPRSGRSLHFRLNGFQVTDPRYSGVDNQIPLRGRFAELPYSFNGPDTFAISAEFSLCAFSQGRTDGAQDCAGERLGGAVYSGTWTQ